jgi:hypothetical protein
MPLDPIFARAVRARGTQIGPAFFPAKVGVQGKQTSYYTRSPWLDMPAGGAPFRYINQAVPAAPAAVFLPVIGSEVVAVSFTVPAGRDCTIQQIANAVVTGGFTDGSGSVVWRLQVDKLPIQGLNNIVATMGTASNPARLENSPSRITENQLVELICRNISLVTAPGVNPIVAMLGGFFSAGIQAQEAMWL